jgi:hypothetical protein
MQDMPDDEDYSEIDTTESEFDAMWAEAESEAVPSGINLYVSFARTKETTVVPATATAEPGIQVPKATLIGC